MVVHHPNHSQRPLLWAVSGLLVLAMALSSGCIAPIQVPSNQVPSNNVTIPDASCLDPTTQPLLHTPALQDVKPTAENLIRCLNSGHYREAAYHVTSELLQSEFGFADPELANERLAGLPPFVVESLDNPQQVADGQFNIDILYRREVGAHMLVHEQWGFVVQNGQLRLNALIPLPTVADADAITVDVRLFDFGYTLSQSTFAAGDTVIFRALNEGEYPHEFVVFRLPTGVTMEAVRQGQFSADFQFIGTASAAPGEPATDLVLVDLEPGTYAVVCFQDEPEALPHVARGMIAEFTVASRAGQ